jgi:hypothetical protein
MAIMLGAILVAAAWLLHFTGTVNGSQDIRRQAQFSILLPTQQHIDPFHSEPT